MPEDNNNDSALADDERLQRAIGRAFSVSGKSAPSLHVDEKSSTIPTSWLIYILSTIFTISFLWFSSNYLSKKEAEDSYAHRKALDELTGSFIQEKRESQARRDDAIKNDIAISNSLTKIQTQLELVIKKVGP